MVRPMLAVVVAAVLPFAFTGEAGPGQKKPASTQSTRAAEVRDALASVMKDLMANKGRVRIGMSAEEADRATPGAAKHITQRFLPLHGSWLDEKSRMNGTIVWEVDVEKGESVDLVCAVLLPGPFDRKDVEETIVEVGKTIGLDMAPDEADHNTWYDAEAEGIEVWGTLGDGIVVVDCSVVPE